MRECFPDVRATGAELPRGVVEMVERRNGRAVLFWNRRVGTPLQRVGILHGAYHLISDLTEGDSSNRECNLEVRQLERDGVVCRTAAEVECDLYAAEILLPFDRLDPASPDQLFPRDPDEKHAFDDICDGLASRFAVPVGFLRWRLWDLMHLRRTNLFIP